MKSIITDPVVLICSGIIIFGLLGLIWAIGKLRRSNNGPAIAPAVTLPMGMDTRVSPYGVPPIGRMAMPEPGVTLPIQAAPGGGSGGAGVGVSKEVADRLETMTQRLAEMQAVLTKQASAPAEGAPIGQGFSPETIDKLLKIIGNVMQQVDILQKSVSKEAPKL